MKFGSINVASTEECQVGRPYAAYAVLIGVLFLTALIYWPGLNGSFLFDDYPNLERLGTRGPIESFELLRLYVTSGFAGPTGRPLSLLSFLIDANNWPTDPWPFKRTNLVIHLIVGVVLYATTRKLLVATGRSARDASWIALLAAGYWLVNPFLVSTTLYAVQRMTQLSALFALGGVWCYLRGRELLAVDRRRGYATLCFGLPLFTLLAVLSKENGALLPLLLLVIHATLSRAWTTPKPSVLWTGTFLVVPSVLIVGYLGWLACAGDRLYVARDFTMVERVLSQPRFLWEYLYYLIVPHIQTQGLFQDGRLVSTGLLHPWTTLPALVGVVALTACAWIWRSRWPLWSLSVLFFFGGHLLESTVVPLELYFEHRNYLPAAFLFLPIAPLMYDALRAPARRVMAAMLTATVAVIYSLATWQHAALWGDDDRLLLVWAERNPTSVRAQVAAAQTWIRNNDEDRALAILEAADQKLPGNALIISNILWVRADLGQLTLAELADGARQIRKVRFDAQAIRALEQLVIIVNSRAPLPDHARVLNELLQGIREDLGGSVPVAERMTTYLQGLLLAGQGRPDEAMPYLSSAFDLYGSMSSGLRIVSDMAVLGHYRVALEFLSRCETLLDDTADSDLDLSRQTYQSDIARLRAELLSDLEKHDAAGRVSSLPQIAIGHDP